MSSPGTLDHLAYIINKTADIKKLDLADVEGNKRFIAGYANIAGIRDSQGDIVTLDALRKAWEKWRQNPDFCLLSILHTNIPVAKVVFDEVRDSEGNTHLSGVDEKGLYIVANVRDDVTIADEVWKDIERGKIRGYSIGGKNLRPRLPECEGDVCTRQITDLELYEVGLVPNPANKVSLFNMLKSDDLAKVAEMTKTFKESIISEGFIKISKVPNQEAGHYHVVVDHEGLRRNVLKMSREMADAGMVFIDEERDGEEYVSLFDIARLRPYSVLTEEKGDGGFGLSPLSDEPKTDGETQMSEEKDVKKEESDDSEEEETPEVKADEEEKDEEENAEAPEAIAPITYESLAADLSRIAGELEKLHKDESVVAETPITPTIDIETMAQRVADIIHEKTKTIEPLKVEEVAAEVEQVAQEVEAEVVAETPTEIPPVEDATEVSAEEEVSEPVFDLASLTQVSYEDIHEIGRKLE